MEPDHCTGWFEGNWAACCAQHDLDYANPLIERLIADNDLATCVAGVGGFTVVVAGIMWLGVRTFGGWFRQRAQPSQTIPTAAESGLFLERSKETQMTDWQNFRGEAKRLDDIDLPLLGHRIGVGEDELHAFMDVEAAGSGFDRTGRPKMLFEPHVFYRNLSGDKRSTAVAKGLAYAKWRAGSYPTDSYPRLVDAMAIDETAALRAASWGLGQILGENHAMVGYATPQEMVRAFMDDEEDHLEAIIAFLIAAGIDDDLRAHRWLTVARVYNGPQHAKHDYAGRMATAYDKWVKIRNTAWEPEERVVVIPTPRPAQTMPAELPGPIGHNGGPVMTPEPAPHVVTPIVQGLSPIEQMNKPVEGAKANAGAATLGAILLTLWASSGFFPDGWKTPEMMAALGMIFTAVPGIVAGFIAGYHARDKRFQPVAAK